MRKFGFKFSVKFCEKFGVNLKNALNFAEKFGVNLRNLSENFAAKFSVNFAGICVILGVLGCGYLPTSKVADSLFGEKIYVRAEISQQDSRNSIYIVDTIRELIINKLGKSPAVQEDADDTIEVRMQSLSFIPIIYDENGYVIAYKARIVLGFVVNFKDGSVQKLSTSGDYDFAISPNSVISDSARFEAIRSASSEAFDEFISVISIKGHQKRI